MTGVDILTKIKATPTPSVRRWSSSPPPTTSAKSSAATTSAPMSTSPSRSTTRASPTPSSSLACSSRSCRCRHRIVMPARTHPLHRRRCGHRRSGQRALAPHGYRVEAVPTATPALARLSRTDFRRDRARPQSRPTRPGLDLIPRLRALPQAPPIIYVTGSEDVRVAVAALEGRRCRLCLEGCAGPFPRTARGG